MDDRDTDALRLLNPIVTVVEPCIGVGDFLSQGCNPLQDFFRVTMRRLHILHVGNELSNRITGHGLSPDMHVFAQ